MSKRTTQKANLKTVKQRSGKNNNGFGSKQIRSAPVAKTQRNRMKGPSMTGLPRGGIRVKHREYLADILGSVGFTSVDFPINPGLGKTFPWLSKVASRYESFRFERLEFSYETESPTTSTGTIVLAVDYDPTDAAPESKTAVLSFEGAVRSAPWDRCSHRSNKANLSKRKSYFVRCGALPSSGSLSLHDVGNLFVITQGQAGASAIGELYVDYDVVFETPQLDPTSLSANVVASTGVASTLIFGTAPVKQGCLDVTISSNTVTFNQSVQILMVLGFSGTTVLRPTFTGGTVTPTVSAADGGAGTSLYLLSLKAKVQPGDTIVFDASASGAITGTTLQFAEFQFSQS